MVDGRTGETRGGMVMVMTEMDMMRIRANVHRSQKIYFVMGQEGSGTYMLENAIKAVHSNVIRRSVPHAHRWPEIKLMLEEHAHLGHFVIPIIIIREKMATLKSVNQRDTTRVLTDSDYHARLHYLMEQTAPFSVHIEIITYEAFVTSEGFRRYFFDRIGLPYPEEFVFYNANDKYYEESVQ